MNEISKRIKQLLLNNNKTQDELAFYCGTTQATISRIMRGDTMPRLELAINIAKFLGCSVDYLIGNTEEVTEKTSFEKQKIAFMNELNDLSLEEFQDAKRFVEFIKSKR